MQTPLCGFGFGDAVIVELLREKGRLPNFGADIDDIVVALDEDMRSNACKVATSLRSCGRKVDLVSSSYETNPRGSA